MANENDHLDKVRSNIKLILRLEEFDNPPYDWLVTVAFYSALHLVHAHLARYSAHPGDHKELRFIMGSCPIEECRVSERCYSNYLSLENYSRCSRYMRHHVSPTRRLETGFHVDHVKWQDAKRYLLVVISEMNLKCGYDISYSNSELST
jgi:hypothetical protein